MAVDKTTLRQRKATSSSSKSSSKGALTHDKRDSAWGRGMDAGWYLSIYSLFMICACPFFVYFTFLVNDSYKGEISAPLIAWYNAGVDGVLSWSFEERWAYFPAATTEGLQVFIVWLTWQIVLNAFVPGPIDHGQLTPAGNLLPYRVNGFNCWIITVVAFCTGSYLGLFKASVVYNHWGSLFVWATIAGLSLTVIAYIKARLFPTHPEDCKFSNSVFYDIFMGVELNPRIGKYFDFKLFFNGRPGIIGWTIINLSFAAAQYERIGYVANSMVALNILHNIYIVDFFYNEGWYLRTIDIAHDHFGYYLAYGDLVWLPYLYPLQSAFLVQNTVDLSTPALIGIYGLGLAGYYIFRSVNAQKDYFRANKGKCNIWGKPAQYISAKFKQTNGTVRESYLLLSGWWGLSRHFNYVGDLMMSLSFCLTCGVTHLMPYFYIIYMTILLVHRVYRDDARCRGKYGKYWEQYCAKVPYKILPYVF